MYSAGRTAAELAFWHWLKTNNPPFVANCVVPDGIFGRVLDVKHVNMGFTSSLAMLKRVLAGSSDGIQLRLGQFTLPILLCFQYSGGIREV
jgi:hypothetical protein